MGEGEGAGACWVEGGLYGRHTVTLYRHSVLSLSPDVRPDLNPPTNLRRDGDLVPRDGVTRTLISAHDQNTFGPTEGQNVHGRKANRRRRRQTNRHHDLVPTPPPPPSPNSQRARSEATVIDGSAGRIQEGQGSQPTTGPPKADTPPRPRPASPLAKWLHVRSRGVCAPTNQWVHRQRGPRTWLTGSTVWDPVSQTCISNRWHLLGRDNSDAATSATPDGRKRHAVSAPGTCLATGGGRVLTPCVTFRLVVVSLRGPGQSPILPFACCVGSLRSVSRCGRCSCWCRFRVRAAQRLVCWGYAGCGSMCRLRVSGAQ